MTHSAGKHDLILFSVKYMLPHAVSVCKFHLPWFLKTIAIEATCLPDCDLELNPGNIPAFVIVFQSISTNSTGHDVDAPENVREFTGPPCWLLFAFHSSNTHIS